MCTKFEHNRRLFRGLPSQMSSWNLAFLTFSRTFSHLSPTVFKQTTPNLTYIQFYMSSNYVPNLAKKKFDFGVTHSQKPPSTEQKTQSITIDIDFNYQFIDTQQVAQQFKFQLKQLSLANWLSFGDFRWNTSTKKKLSFWCDLATSLGWVGKVASCVPRLEVRGQLVSSRGPEQYKSFKPQSASRFIAVSINGW